MSSTGRKKREPHCREKHSNNNNYKLDCSNTGHYIFQAASAVKSLVSVTRELVSQTCSPPLSHSWPQKTKKSILYFTYRIPEGGKFFWVESQSDSSSGLKSLCLCDPGASSDVRRCGTCCKSSTSKILINAEPFPCAKSLVLPQVGILELLHWSQFLQYAFRLRVSRHNHLVVPLVSEHLIHCSSQKKFIIVKARLPR